MGHCYEFALDITPGCGNAMAVSPEGGVCECSACGARCTGRFEGCTQVLARPGYLPATAPRWARGHGRSEHPAAGPSAKSGNGEPVIDLVALQHETRELQSVTRDLRATIDRATGSAGRSTTLTGIGTVRRADLARLFEGIRHELDLVTRRQAEVIDRLTHAVDRLTVQADADRRTLRSVVEGLDRLARRFGNLPRE